MTKEQKEIISNQIREAEQRLQGNSVKVKPIKYFKKILKTTKQY